MQQRRRTIEKLGASPSPSSKIDPPSDRRRRQRSVPCATAKSMFPRIALAMTTLAFLFSGSSSGLVARSRTGVFGRAPSNPAAAASHLLWQTQPTPPQAQQQQQTPYQSRPQQQQFAAKRSCAAAAAAFAYHSSTSSRTCTFALRMASSTSSPTSSSTTTDPSKDAGAATTESQSQQQQPQQQQQQQQLLRVGLDYLQTAVVDCLNDLYDPKAVARGRAQQQLQKKKGNKKEKKKKKQNNKGGSDDADGSKAEKDDQTTTKMTPEQEEDFVQQMVDAAPAQFGVADAAVTAATRADFGDYQINAALQLAGALGDNPRTVAQQICDSLQPQLDELAELEIAGPGFVNVAWRNDYLQDAVRSMARDHRGRLAVPTAAATADRQQQQQQQQQKQKIVVDFSSPNIAKEMHVGHLRSTIIGDTLCNLLEFVGHNVVRLNHVGDWGTQFGMLVEHLRDECPAALDPDSSETVDLGDLVVLYKAAKKRFDADSDFQTRARNTVVALQAGEPTAVAAWETLCAASRVEYNQIYERLHIQGLQERGESFYNPFLNDVIADLEQQGLAVESDGATVVFLDGFTNRDGSPLPMLVRKSDGGFNYATTDLAAVRHRSEFADGERADRVLYVTDAGQSMHFEMVFAAAQKAGFVDPAVTSLEHVPFGLVQGADGKKFATRSGDTVKLKDLLDEAVRIAGEDLRERYRDTEDQAFWDRVDRVAAIVGIGAVKYADLSMNRESNYRFSYERMLSLNGNTAPYMLYAYARICGIVRKAVGQADDGTDGSIEWPEAADEIIISHSSEKELMRSLVKLPDVIREVERDLYPHRLCDYLFETSQKFNQFYENCSVMKAESPELKASRLSLCMATAGTIRLLLTLLGIEVVEKL